MLTLSVGEVNQSMVPMQRRAPNLNVLRDDAPLSIGRYLHAKF